MKLSSLCRTAVVAAALGISALVAPPASAAGSGGPDAGASAGAASGSHPAGVVLYWGYSPDKGDWQSASTSVKSTTDISPQNYKGVTTAATAAPMAAAAGAFVCSQLTSNVTLWGGALRANTLGQCSGQFIRFYQGAQFKRDAWNGWHNYSGVITFDTTAGYQQAVDWWANCNLGGDPGGTYNYRLTGIMHTMDTDGYWHTGPSVWSGSNFRTACGSGIG